MNPSPTWLAQIDRERPRLVRLCARVSGDPDAAEDLAQETILAAHRAAAELRDPERWREWLSGVARNVCWRWRRRRGRDAARQAPGRRDPARRPADDLDLEPADDLDVERELERAELADLLDRALALLPAETRAVLVARFVEQSPVGEIARRLGLSEGAVAMRLQRGKLTLRRVLLSDFRAQAASYGLVEADAWQTTRIWCPACGQHRMVGRFSDDHAEFWVQCPDCTPPGGYGWHCCSPALFGDVRAFKPALTRFIRATSGSRLALLGGPTVPCLGCGRPTAVRMGMPVGEPAVAHIEPGFHTRCGCGFHTESSLLGVVLGLPEAERLWRDQPRIRRLPLRTIGEADGRPALLTRLASVGTSDRLEVVSDAETLRVLAVRRR